MQPNQNEPSHPQQPQVVTPAPVPPSPGDQSIYPEPTVSAPIVTNHQTAANQQESKKEYVPAFLFSYFFGVFAVDRFYLGYIPTGLLKLFTLGGFGIWSYIDMYRIAFGKLRDKQNLPLKGYNDNKKWIKIIAAITVLLPLLMIVLGIVVAIIIVSLDGTQQKARDGTQQKARDTERKTDINAISASVESYQAKTGIYPSLEQMNSASFRKENMPSLSDEALKDPKGQEAKLVSGATANAYAYIAAPSGCTNQSDNKCLSYKVIATLEAGGSYSKDALNGSTTSLVDKETASSTISNPNCKAFNYEGYAVTVNLVVENVDESTNTILFDTSKQSVVAGSEESPLAGRKPGNISSNPLKYDASTIFCDLFHPGNELSANNLKKGQPVIIFLKTSLNDKTISEIMPVDQFTPATN